MNNSKKRRAGQDASRQPLVLALDIGTSSVRSSLFDRRGRRVDAASAQRAYALEQNTPGQAELVPGTLLRAARQCLRKTLQARDSSAELRRRPVVAVGASCFWHSLLGVDADGEPLTPIYTWADARSAREAERLRRNAQLQ
ncbi:MAG: FGGY family carbohydrate kinase, partial [Gammaproteobacteria bacterium]